ncbi:MAG: NADPH:quinone oxidoreductase family protein [Hyphomicrobiaceae bacterium]|nr:NADPH:quinone oxidoreductase family protein [Hyphomicrobiaceae bacterium]
MKAALCKSLDGPDGIVVEDVAEPVAGPGEAIVRVRAAALNFFDTLMTRGKYQHKPELPFSPAGEIAGVVESLGPGAEGTGVGQRVQAYLGWGGARERVAVRASDLIPIPDSVSDDVAAGLSITYGTAIHGLAERGRLRPGETLAVLGASGGAGLAAVEVGKLLGAEVIAVASSADKLEVCKAHGADHLLNYGVTDLKDGLKTITGGKGVDVVYDCVGGPHSEPALRAMAWKGRFLVVGFAAGEIPRLPLNLLLLKGCDAIGVFWGESVKRDPAGHRVNMLKVLDWVASGRLVPHVHAAYPLAEIAEAVRVLDGRAATGKVVLKL